MTTPKPNSYLSEWSAVAKAADEGLLFLDPTAAQICSSACEAFIKRLVDHQRSFEGMTFVKSWGDFTAGRQLRDFYAGKAVGGANNMVDVLQSHIDVVAEMKVVFDKFFAATEDNEQQNASDIGRDGER